MSRVAFLVSFFAAMPAALAGQANTNPLSTALELLDSLTAKVTAEVDAAAKAYKEYEAWCDDESSNLKFEIKSGEAKKEQLQAAITKATADIAASDEKIEALSGSISADEQELKEATQVRAKEGADFASSEAELIDAMSTLDRATSILQKEMSKNPAAFAQVDKSNVNNLVKSLGAVIDAASFTASDQKKLVALAQAQTQDGDDDDLAAPAGSVYKTHSGSIFDMLEDLKEKAEVQLNDLRKAESSAKHSYMMLKQSLSDQISADSKDLNDEKASKAAQQESKAVAEGDLAETTSGLDSDKSSLNTANMNCRTAAADHEASQKARSEELSALALAKKVLSETSSGAASRTYSFLEVEHQSQFGSRLHSRADLANAEIVHLLKKVAKENHSAALAQLASRIAAALRYGSTAGQDPFTKVRQLISDLLAKLQGEAQADMTEKAYCDGELAKSSSKKAELDALMEKLSTKIDQATTGSARLQSEVKESQAALAQMARSQAEMDSMRAESHQEYLQAKSDLELGLRGVRQVITVLKDYYGGSTASLLQTGSEQPEKPESYAKSGEAGGEILNELEIVESDFARDLATEETAEADAQAEYEKMTKTNKDSKSVKEQDIKYKTREFKGLDKTTTELGGDKETTGAEHDAVLEYVAKLKERCVGKAEAATERMRRREAEIAGLKEALAIVEGEGAFVQRKKHGLHGAFLGPM